MRKTKKNYVFGDLFGGVGGLSVGFGISGFDSLFFNEIDETAAKTHQINSPSTISFVCPIQELTANRIRDNSALGGNDLDVMVGGPPCQGFSINAPVRTNDDPRNGLFNHYVRLVLEGLRPKFVLMENVPGLISLDGGRTLKDVRAAFERAGYKVIYKILNAAHYGVPEERWRLFFLGSRVDGVDLRFPDPTHSSIQRPNFTGGRDHVFRHAIGPIDDLGLFPSRLKKPVTIGEALGDLPVISSGGGFPEMDFNSKPTSDYQRLMRDGAVKLFNHECAGISSINLKRLKYIKPGGSWRDIPYDLLPKGLQRARRSDHTKRYGRLDPDGLSGTILTKCDPHWGSFFHYNQDRVISVREAARIQSFPDWFRFSGSRTEQYRGVGNAVPPLLAHAIASLIRNWLEAAEGHHIISNKLARLSPFSKEVVNAAF